MKKGILRGLEVVFIIFAILGFFGVLTLESDTEPGWWDRAVTNLILFIVCSGLAQICRRFDYYIGLVIGFVILVMYRFHVVLKDDERTLVRKTLKYNDNSYIDSLLFIAELYEEYHASK